LTLPTALLSSRGFSSSTPLKTRTAWRHVSMVPRSRRYSVPVALSLFQFSFQVSSFSLEGCIRTLPVLDGFLCAALFFTLGGIGTRRREEDECCPLRLFLICLSAPFLFTSPFILSYPSAASLPFSCSSSPSPFISFFFLYSLSPCFLTFPPYHYISNIFVFFSFHLPPVFIIPILFFPFPSSSLHFGLVLLLSLHLPPPPLFLSSLSPPSHPCPPVPLLFYFLLLDLEFVSFSLLLTPMLPLSSLSCSPSHSFP